MELATGVGVVGGCRALRGQAEVFGPVASDTTAQRALGEIGDGYRAAIGRARAAARAHMWHGSPVGCPSPGSPG